MARQYERREKTSVIVPMPRPELHAQLRAEGFVFPKRARVHSEVLIKLPLDWSVLRSAVNDFAGSILDAGGVERYRFHPGDDHLRAMFEPVKQIAYYSKNNGSQEHQTRRATPVSNDGYWNPTAQPRCHLHPEIELNAFRVTAVRRS